MVWVKKYRIFTGGPANINEVSHHPRCLAQEVPHPHPKVVGLKYNEVPHLSRWSGYRSTAPSEVIWLKYMKYCTSREFRLKKYRTLTGGPANIYSSTATYQAIWVGRRMIELPRLFRLSGSIEKLLCRSRHLSLPKSVPRL